MGIYDLHFPSCALPAPQQSAPIPAPVPSAQSPRVNNRLTARQAEVLDFICVHADETGGVPSIRETGERFAIRSTNGIYTHLHYLARKGFLAMPEIAGVNRGRSRSYRILRRSDGVAVRLRLVPID